MERECKTAEDAHLRILEARTGSLVDPTQEYLEALLKEIEQWKEKISQRYKYPIEHFN